MTSIQKPALVSDRSQVATEATVLWFIPTHGDGRYLGSSIGARPLTPEYMMRVAQAADDLGYYGVLLPTGRSCEDSWVVASALAMVTKHLRFLVAVRPGLQTPAVAARMAATLDRISDGRLLINVVTGGDPEELRGDGVFLSHEDRYAVTDEFLHIWRGLIAGDSVTFHGKHLQIENGKVLYPPIQQPGPPLYFGGSSEIGQSVAAAHVDHYLTWGEPPAQVAEKIAATRAAFAKTGRTPRFGIRLHVIVRETAAAAWEAANQLIKYVDDAAIAKAQAVFARYDSVGQQRMASLHHGRRDNLEISPNLWAGVGLVRGGAGTALVGDPETVAERMREYMALGIETFILSGYPHLEEAYSFAELVFPLLPLSKANHSRGEGSGVASPVYTGPFGEIIANSHLPTRQSGQS